MGEKILVVDDSIDNRRLIAAVLGKKGYEVLEAASGHEAIDRAPLLSPDLILLDIMMPGPDGYEVCKRLKTEPGTRDIPIIFLSAKTDAVDKVKGLEMGAADYITKPFDKAEVIARVQSQLKIRALTQDLRLANQRLAEKQKKIEEDLLAASGIQQSLLPRNLPEAPELEFAWEFLPSHFIGGDIFNIFWLDRDTIGVYMLDVSGHGVPSALVTVSISQALQPQAGLVRKKDAGGESFVVSPPGEVIRALDSEYPTERFDKFFTIIYMVLGLKERRLSYCSAGHPFPVLMRANGGTELLEKGGSVIGLGGLVPFEEETIFLEKGDKLILYTDGMTDCRNSSGEFFGMEGLLGHLSKKRDMPIAGLLRCVLGELLEFGGSSCAEDDISLLGMEFR